MKILIVNQHANNFGDEAAGAAVVNCLLKIEKVEKIEILYCMSGFIPVKDGKVIHNHDIDIRKAQRKDFLKYFLTKKASGDFIPKFISKLEEYDVVLVSPCGANLGIYRSWNLLLQDMLVINRKKKLIFHLNTISASGKWIFDRLVLRMCKKAEVYVREKASLEFLRTHKVNAKWGTDSAFLLETQGEVEKVEDRIVFVPSDLWSWHKNFVNRNRDDFKEKILKPIGKFAVNNKVKIIIVPHINNKEEHEFNEKIVKEMLRNYPEIEITTVEANTAYEYENWIRSSKMVVGMRYHSIVFACKNAIPFVSLAYEQKMKEVCQYSNQMKSLVDLRNNFDEQEIYNKLEYVLSNYDLIHKDLYNQLDSFRENAKIVIKEQFEN